jgi:hypothetical protein
VATLFVKSNLFKLYSEQKLINDKNVAANSAYKMAGFGELPSAVILLQFLPRWTMTRSERPPLLVCVISRPEAKYLALKIEMTKGAVGDILKVWICFLDRNK